MFREPKPLRQIHKIQEAIYKEEKNLTSKERIIKIRKEADALRRKFKLTTKQTV